MKLPDTRSLFTARTSRPYPVGTQELAGAIEHAVRTLPRWTLAHATEGEIRAVRKRRVFLRDDATVWLTPSPAGAHTNTRADFLSTSRFVLAWNLGQNTRNLKELLAAIDHKLMADH